MLLGESLLASGRGLSSRLELDLGTSEQPCDKHGSRFEKDICSWKNHKEKNIVNNFKNIANKKRSWSEQRA